MKSRTLLLCATVLLAGTTYSHAQMNGSMSGSMSGSMDHSMTMKDPMVGGATMYPQKISSTTLSTPKITQRSWQQFRRLD